MIDGGEHADNVFRNIAIDASSNHRRNYALYLDIDKRRPESTLGQINRTTFENLAITTRGSVLIGGQKEAPIRDLTLRNVAISVARPQPLDTTGPKPGGNRNRQKQAGTEDFAETNSTLVIAHVEGLKLENVTVSEAGTGRAPPALLHVNGVSGMIGQ
jgi:hypothetical protein